MITTKNGFVYIMTNANNIVLYTGVTSDLRNRIGQHRQKLIPGFTLKYNVVKLVYYECFDFIADAIAREKQIKAGSRKKKMNLIIVTNPHFDDLYDQL